MIDCVFCGTNQPDNSTHCRRCGQPLDGYAPLILQEPKPKKQKFRAQPTDNTRQGMLFSGLDCLAGQTELFNPDGPKEKDEET